MEAQVFDEEARGLLKKVIEGQAYRQLVLSDIRGHGIKFLPDVGAKLALARALETSLVQFREVERLYAQLGFGDVVSAVRNKMERVPYPATRMELAVCLFLCESVSHHALAAYRDCVARDFAAIARTRLEELRPLAAPEDPAFLEFCSDEANRPHAQQLFNRWLAVTLLALGRPGSAGDARAVALGLRSRPVGLIVADYLAGLAPFVAACKLAIPAASTLGIEIPAKASAP